MRICAYLILALGLLSIAHLRSAGRDVGHPVARPLSTAELAGIVGGAACKDCQADSKRVDECYHYGFLDPCQTNMCLSTYLVGDTCVLGSGTCNGILMDDVVRMIGYVRQDIGCQTNNPNMWNLWATQYYGECEYLDYITRCEKTNGMCNGTLIDSGTATPGIACQ